MQLKPTIPLAASVTAALTVSLAGIGLSVTTASAMTRPNYTHTTTVVAAADDTFVAKESPQTVSWSLTRLVAENSSSLHKQT